MHRYRIGLIGHYTIKLSINYFFDQRGYDSVICRVHLIEVDKQQILSRIFLISINSLN